MKIVAEISKTQFMVSVSKDELAQILGYRDNYRMGNNDAFNIGTTVAVTKISNAAEAIRGARDRIKDNANNLRKLANELDNVNAVEITDL